MKSASTCCLPLNEVGRVLGRAWQVFREIRAPPCSPLHPWSLSPVPTMLNPCHTLDWVSEVSACLPDWIPPSQAPASAWRGVSGGCCCSSFQQRHSPTFLSWQLRERGDERPSLVTHPAPRGTQRPVKGSICPGRMGASPGLVEFVFLVAAYPGCLPLVVVSLWAEWVGCIWTGSRVGQNSLESIPG